MNKQNKFHSGCCFNYTGSARNTHILILLAKKKKNLISGVGHSTTLGGNSLKNVWFIIRLTYTLWNKTSKKGKTIDTIHTMYASMQN